MRRGGVENKLLGSMSSPIVMRKPPRENSSGLLGFSFARTPISTLADSGSFEICSFQTPESGGA